MKQNIVRAVSLALGALTLVLSAAGCIVVNHHRPRRAYYVPRRAHVTVVESAPAPVVVSPQ